MKILIAFDGSEASDDILIDLTRAGLPRRAEVHLITVADVFLPPPEAGSSEVDFTGQIPAVVKRAHQRALAALAAARRTADKAGRRVRSLFADWEVQTDALADSPAWAIVRVADEWQPDLIITGAKGNSSFGGRLILGSVAQRVLYEASGSVRIARSRESATEGPLRIIIGYDGSPDSAVAVAAVAARSWPAGTEARMVMVLSGSIFEMDSEAMERLNLLEDDEVRDHELARAASAPALQKLEAAGLIASLQFRSGRPKPTLIEEAASWDADAIFLGAKGIRGVERFLLGSVAAAVAARAPCSVEVVRSRVNLAE